MSNTWVVHSNLDVGTLQGRLNQLTYEGYDIIQIDFVQPYNLGDKYSSGGYLYNIIAFKR